MTADHGHAALTSAGAADTLWTGVANRLRHALVGEFEVYGLLGQGGMAAVFLAHEYALNRKVALKVMSPALMMGDGMIERFRQEAITQANLQHANIVAVHGVRAVEELQFFVMQFVPGRTLQQAARAEREAGRVLSLDVVRSVIAQAGAALAYAHRRRVIHRDVKPGNILLNADGDAVVTDFGIAKVAENPGLTMTGAVVGTPAYMSPEQCIADELTEASDQYSLGIVAYELLAGRPPFEGSSFVVMQGHTTQEPPPLRELRADCPPEFEAALQLMLAKYPQDRFPDMVEALHGLGANAASMRGDDAVRADLRRLANVAEVEERIASLLSAPLSPIPQTRRTFVSPTLSPTETSDPALPVAAEPSNVAAQPPAAVPTPVVDHKKRMMAIGGGAVLVTAAVIATVLARVSPATTSGTTVIAEPPAVEAPSPGQAVAPPESASIAPQSAGTAPPPVVDPPVASVIPAAGRLVIARLSTPLEVGQTVRLQARSEGGNPADVVRWRSRGAAVITVDARGQVTAVRPGQAVIVATRGDLADSVTLMVREAAPAAPSPAPVESRPAPVEVPPPRPAVSEPRAEVRPTPVTPAAEVDEAALLAGAKSSVERYAAAIGTKDTIGIRRAFPGAGAAVMNRWQSMFEAAEKIRVSVSDAQPIDDFPPAVGGTVRMRVKQQITFALKGARDQSSASEYVATLRRDTNGWSIVSISDR